MAKILIIEDEIDMQKVLRKRLSIEGFEVISACEGYKGVEMALKENPDLIILDLMLPVGDGLAVLKNIRLSSNTWNIPIVVLTGKDDSDYKEKIIKEGVDAFLTKPYDSDSLINIINECIKK